MNYASFRTLAGRMYDEIPAAFQEGVAGVSVESEAREHPALAGIWTLGECVTQCWPDPLGGLGDTRSEIILYHGSFERLASGDPRFDWRTELWETMLHELLHHREAAADEEGLDVLDWAADQNFRRLAGRAFDPLFHRALPADEEGAVRLDGETFLDVRLRPADSEAGFAWRKQSWSIRLPPGTELIWVRVRNLAGGRLWVIAERSRPWWTRLTSRRTRDMQMLDRRALPPAPA